MFEIRREDLRAYHHLITHWTGSCTPKIWCKTQRHWHSRQEVSTAAFVNSSSQARAPPGNGTTFQCWFMEPMASLPLQFESSNGDSGLHDTCALGCPPELSKCRKWSCAACDIKRKREKTHGMNGRSLTWHWNMSHLFKNTTTAP
jgi:hypothetical protein